MRKATNFLNDLCSDDDGQAIVEYILMLSVAIAIVGVFAGGLRRSLASIWQAMARSITAACATCPAPVDVRIR